MQGKGKICSIHSGLRDLIKTRLYRCSLCVAQTDLDIVPLWRREGGGDNDVQSILHAIGLHRIFYARQLTSITRILNDERRSTVVERLPDKYCSGSHYTC
jgi:hypothetical protein